VKIVSIEDMHVAGGVRHNMSFLKMVTDDGLVGWSEYNEEYQVPAMAIRPGITALVRQFGQRAIGMDPRNVSAIEIALRGGAFRPHYGLEQYAIGAIVNACLDIWAKSLDVRVCDLFGGPVREQLPVYWSHCGTYRALYADALDAAPVRSFDDLRALGAEVRDRGFRALKTNEIARYLRPDGDSFSTRLFRAYPERTEQPGMVEGIREVLAAFREGAGDEVRLIIDVNTVLKTTGVRALAKALEPFDLMWLETDNLSPSDLAMVRQSTSTPMGSLETVLGTHDLLPYLQASSVDVCLIDPQHNGLAESLRMASLAEAFDVNVSSHSAYSGLSVLFGAHFCASVPNLAQMEFDIDQPKWMSEILTHPPTIDDVVDGYFVMPTRPGWGTDVNEEGVLANPPTENPAAPWLLDYHRRAGAV
jgi:galactonate dehydratase